MPAADKPRALSLVLAGGVFAGVLGPQLVTATMNQWPPHAYAATYLCAAAVSVLSALVLRDGPITGDGAINPAAKLSNQYAATMAALSGKLRLCKSATTRPESAGLKKALHSGVKPWETSPEMAEYFND